MDLTARARKSKAENKFTRNEYTVHKGAWTCKHARINGRKNMHILSTQGCKDERTCTYAVRTDTKDATRDIVERFVVQAEGLVGVLDQLVHRQRAVVRLDDGVRDLISVSRSAAGQASTTGPYRCLKNVF